MKPIPANLKPYEIFCTGCQQAKSGAFFSEAQKKLMLLVGWYRNIQRNVCDLHELERNNNEITCGNSYSMLYRVTAWAKNNMRQPATLAQLRRQYCDLLRGRALLPLKD